MSGNPGSAYLETILFDAKRDQCTKDNRKHEQQGISDGLTGPACEGVRGEGAFANRALERPEMLHAFGFPSKSVAKRIIEELESLQIAMPCFNRVTNENMIKNLKKLDIAFLVCYKRLMAQVTCAAAKHHSCCYRK